MVSKRERDGVYAESAAGNMTSQGRRRMLKTVASVGVGVGVAGCSGGGDASATTSGGIQAGEVEQLKELSAEEWRKTVSRQAEKELKEENLQFYAVSKNPKFIEGIRDHDYEGVYEPLTNSINVVKQSGDTLTQRYQREVQADKRNIDVTDLSNIDALIKAGVPFGDLTHIPAYQDLPEDVKIHPQFGIKNQVVYGLSYNTEMVSAPPQSWDELMADRFDDGTIVLDWTPKTIMMPVMLDIKGESWLQNLADQNPTLIKSTYGVPKQVAQGNYGVGYLANYKHPLKFKREGLPTEPVWSREASTPTVAPMGMAAKPQHPWASYLFLDKYFQWTDMQVLVEGAVAADRSAAKPSKLLELVEGKTIPAFFQFENSIESYETTYQNAIGAPTN